MAGRRLQAESRKKKSTPHASSRKAKRKKVYAVYGLKYLLSNTEECTHRNIWISPGDHVSNIPGDHFTDSMTISTPEEHRKKTGRRPTTTTEGARQKKPAVSSDGYQAHASAHAHTCTHARLRSIPMVENGRRIFRKTSGYNALCSFQNVFSRIRRSFLP